MQYKQGNNGMCNNMDAIILSQAYRALWTIRLHFFIRLISSVQVHDPLQPKEDVPSAKTFHTSEHKSTVSASDLSERWFIGLKQATQTIKSTSQWLLRSAILPLA